MTVSVHAVNRMEFNGFVMLFIIFTVKNSVKFDTGLVLLGQCNSTVNMMVGNIDLVELITDQTSAVFFIVVLLW